MLQNLLSLALFNNQLMGTLPPSWSELVNVSHINCHKEDVLFCPQGILLVIAAGILLCQAVLTSPS